MTNSSAVACQTEKTTETNRRFGRGDLVLLEQELQAKDLEPAAYVSAIRFALAVERDCDYFNCVAQNFKFHQIVLDCAMHMYLANTTVRAWVAFADAFRNYEKLTPQERRRLVDRAEQSLPNESLTA